jgi:hypothetical protein
VKLTWLGVAALGFAIAGMVLDAGHRWVYAVGMIGILLFLVSEGFFRLMGNASPVPNSAVRALVSSCHESTDDWVIVRFAPRRSLAEARRKAGTDAYTDEDRVDGFMGKLSIVAPLSPEVAVYYSANKGIVAADPGALRRVEGRYGRFMINTWHTLLGALRSCDMTAVSLDGPQDVSALMDRDLDRRMT